MEQNERVLDRLLLIAHPQYAVVRALLTENKRRATIKKYPLENLNGHSPTRVQKESRSDTEIPSVQESTSGPA